MANFDSLGPLFLSSGAMLVVVALFGRQSRFARAFCSLMCVFLALRYVYWRFFWSIPLEQSAIQTLWAWIFFGFESLSVFTSITVNFFMSRVRSRSADADAAQSSPLLKAPVDVFIATYNEGYEILERTIVGATNIDHPDLRVWVLDDGARDWVRELAVEMGAHYVCRIKGKHAKAGNVNNGLAHALNTGRKPEFILLLDADFVANRIILKRTLGLFEDKSVGIVQTPQHFWNPDPIQSNLFCSSVWPDEQRFFFNNLLECKDAWGAAFCCGTSAVFRVAAFEAAGGMAIETVTEDMLTTFKFGEYGYRTIFLNEPLSLGLAPEGLQEYISQRSRWCLGAIQQVYTRWSFFGRAKITWINRLSCLDGICFWAFTFPFKLLMVTAPLIYWWTGTAVIDSTVDDLMYWLAPSAVASMVFMAVFASGRVMPIMTDVTQLLSALVIIRSVVTGFLRPWGHAFKVTAKGVNNSGVTVQWRMLFPFAAMALATLTGIVINTSPYSPLSGTPGYAVNVFWSIFNIVMLCIAVAVCVELPKRRKDERFFTQEEGIILVDGQEHPCRLRDISLGGARIARTEACAPGQSAVIALDGGALHIPFTAVRIIGEDLAVQFDQSPVNRRRLIAKLFTGRYDNEVEKVKVGKVLWRLAVRLLA